MFFFSFFFLDLFSPFGPQPPILVCVLREKKKKKKKGKNDFCQKKEISLPHNTGTLNSLLWDDFLGFYVT